MKRVGHLSAVAMVLGGMGVMISGYHSWAEAFTPANVGAMLMTLAGVFTAMSGEPIQGRRVWTDEERRSKLTP